MNSVSVANLPIGSFIDQPVYLDDKYVLLSPDIPISEALKKRLQEWNYSKVFTDGTPVEAPPEIAPVLTTDDSGNGASPSKAVLDTDYKEQEQMREVRTFFQEMTAFLADVFELYLRNNIFQLNRISEQVKACTDMIKSKRKYISQINLLNDTDHSYLISHSIKTTIIALVLADILKLPPFKQIEVGMAGLLHEIGMLRIPPQLYMSSKTLSPEEKKTIAAHTVLGFRILKSAEFPLTVCRAVLESHERIDGSGYPRGLTGDKISFYAKILTIASSYAAIVSKRPYRDAVDGHTGIMDLLKNTGKQYDEQLIRVLVYTLSVYPVGTYVALSNGAQGIVVETDSDKPKFPIVKLLLNGEGSPFRDQPILHTEGGEGIHIVRPLVQKEIQNIQTVINK